MVEIKNTHQQQRSRDREVKPSCERSGIFRKLKRPQTLRLAFKASLWVFRLVRLALRVFELFE
jgi:hypothetical protein